MNTAKPTKKRRRILIWGSIGLVIAAGGIFAATRNKVKPISVEVQTVGLRDLTETVMANGRIQPVVQVKISPEVSGEIIELAVREGDQVEKGDLLLRIKPDFYQANARQAEASYKSSLTDQVTAAAQLKKVEAEFKRNEELFLGKLISESIFSEQKAAYEIAKATAESSAHRIEMSQAVLSRSQDDLAKTTIVSPLTGTISKLNSERGERVVGTAQMAGTEVLIVADLNSMEARVDVGEIDVVLIKPGQKATLEVDAFRDRKFTGVVTEIANSSRVTAATAQDAVRYEVKIRVDGNETFRPGMSVTAEIETRYHYNVLAVPIQAVSVRLPKENATNEVTAATNSASTNSANGTPTAEPGVTKTKKKNEPPKPMEVVFGVEGDHAKLIPVKLGISDDTHIEITEGLAEGQRIISGGYKAVSRDLDDGKLIKETTATNAVTVKK